AVLKLGYKGILSLSFNLDTLNNITHSSFKPMIPNAASELLSLLKIIYDDGQFHLKCLNQSLKISEVDLAMIKNIINGISLEKFKKKVGINTLLERDFEQAFIKYLYQPTFNISTFKAGYLGTGIQNIVPNTATCNLDIRLPPNFSIEEVYDEIFQKVKKFKSSHPFHVEMIKNSGYEGSRTDMESPLVKSLIKSFEIMGYSTEIWPFSAAAAPLSVIKKKLGKDFLVGGLGIGGHAHGPNEFIQLESILPMRMSYYYFLMEYSNHLKME
ncbi:MAG: peptidase dimerization domain-containing protein, partial [Promethearchaeota archaeon]